MRVAVAWLCSVGFVLAAGACAPSVTDVSPEIFPAAAPSPADAPAPPSADATEVPIDVSDASPADVAASDEAVVDPSIRGTWFLTVAAQRYVLALDGDGARGVSGTLRPEAGTDVATCAFVPSEPERLRLRCTSADASTLWIDGRTRDGVLVGRVARVANEPRVADYREHVTGWNATVVDRDVVPRVWELRLGSRTAILRLDRDASGALLGSIKVCASAERGAFDEELQRDIAVDSWDGEQLTFRDYGPDGMALFAARVDGRSIRGLRYDPNTNEQTAFAGTRAEVLSRGLARRADEAIGWATRTRAQLQLLAMAGAPSPNSLTVRDEGAAVPAATPRARPASRDDVPLPGADYERTAFSLRATLADPRGGPDLTREIHGVRAVPRNLARPAEGYPLAIVLNGHYGSAAQTFDPDNFIYWYGDAWALQGYVVVAIDVGHRPVTDRGAIYRDFAEGDDPSTGNAVHPAIRSAALDSDFEEEGERVWDAQRAIDYALATLPVSPRRIMVTGLSMGGEAASWVGAMDTRVAVTLAAGYAPDLYVMRAHGNHPCWRWANAELTEYVSVSDVHALIAPRGLVVETGLADFTYSSFVEPFASDKQVMQRARLAWPEGSSTVLHYLHDDEHRYRMGGPTQRNGLTGVRTPLLDAPMYAGDTAWQSDRSTSIVSPLLADVLDRWSL